MDANTQVRFRWTGVVPEGLPPNGFTVSWNPLLPLPKVGDTVDIQISSPWLLTEEEVRVIVDRVSSGVHYTPNGVEMMAVLWVRRA